jgi:ferredoxin
MAEKDASIYIEREKEKWESISWMIERRKCVLCAVLPFSAAVNMGALLTGSSSVCQNVCNARVNEPHC